MQGLRAGVVLVSHDREFLSRVVTRVVELDLAQHRVAVYDGGYDAFLEERAVARRHAREAYEEFADKKADLLSRARIQREWSSQGVRNAIEGPDNDKIRRKAQVESSRSRPRRSARWSPGSHAWRSTSLARVGAALHDRQRPTLSSVVATLDEASASLGPFTFGPASLRSSPVTGSASPAPTGRAETTLRLLLGRLPRHRQGRLGHLGRGRRDRPGPHPAGRGPALGRRVRDGDAGDGSRRRADAAGQVRPQGRPGHQPGRQALAGERTRAAMALLQARGVNLLVLDEPTSHLDLPAIERSGEALESYDGSLLLVSHDRRLLDNVRSTSAGTSWTAGSPSGTWADLVLPPGRVARRTTGPRRGRVGGSAANAVRARLLTGAPARTARGISATSSTTAPSRSMSTVDAVGRASRSTRCRSSATRRRNRRRPRPRCHPA